GAATTRIRSVTATPWRSFAAVFFRLPAACPVFRPPCSDVPPTFRVPHDIHTATRLRPLDLRPRWHPHRQPARPRLGGQRHPDLARPAAPAGGHHRLLHRRRR